MGSKCFVAVAGTEKKQQQRNGQTVNLAQRAIVLGCMVDAYALLNHFRCYADLVRWQKVKLENDLS